GGATTVDPAGQGAPEARPDQLTSFDIPAGQAAAEGGAGDAAETRAAGPGETAPDPDRAASWRSGPRADPAGGTVPAGHAGARAASSGPAPRGGPGGGTVPAGHAVPGAGAVPHGGPAPGGSGRGEPVPTSAYFPPTPHAAARPALVSNRNVLIIAAVALVIIVIIAIIALANGGGEKKVGKEGATSPATGAAPAVPAPPLAETASAVPTSSRSGL